MTALAEVERSFGARKALKSVDVVSALSNSRSVFSMVFVASLHVLHHFTAGSVADLNSTAAEVRLEEVGEGWHVVLFLGCTDDLVRIWWGEEDWSVDVEALHVWVLELANAVVLPSCLEGVSSNHNWMSMV